MQAVPPEIKLDFCRDSIAGGPQNPSENSSEIGGSGHHGQA
jgi:hypothetical protein